MTWVFIGLVVIVVAAVAAVAVGRGEGLAVAAPDRREVAVPAGRALTGADLDAVGFTVGLRGYRMDEVDDLLARLATEIEERDRYLAALRAPRETVPVPVAVPATAGAPTVDDASEPAPEAP